jgi:hypothetical protein
MIDDIGKRYIKNSIREGINGIIDESRPLDSIGKRKIECDSLIYMYEHRKPKFGYLTRFYDQSNPDIKRCGFQCKSILKYYYNKYSFLQNKYFIKSGNTYSRKIREWWKDEDSKYYTDYNYYTFGEIVYDYDFIKKTKELLNKEFIAWYYHPSRMDEWIDDEDM